MVHGINVGLQYIFLVDRDIDYYDDILKLSIDIRKKLFEKNKKSFIIYNISNFNKRFSKLENSKKYLDAFNIIKQNNNISRQANPDIFVYYDVMVYNKEKHNYFNKLSLDEFNKLENEFKKLNDDDDYDTVKYERIDELHNILDIQHIIMNSEYFEKIKKLENELINITLTKEEIEIINKIENHSLFHFDVIWHGFELVIESY
jgi:hypothetical protein